MLRQKKRFVIVLYVLGILIQNISENEGAKWNSDCYSKNDCYKLLEKGKKLTWSEAYNLCRKEQGYLLNDTWINSSERITLLQTIIGNNNTWTSLHMVNGYIQEDAKQMSYSSFFGDLWKTYPVLEHNTCVKLTSEKKLEATNCSVRLPVICISDLEEISEPVSDCNHNVNPTLSVEVLGISADVPNGHLELGEEDQKNVVFGCKITERNMKINWIKDGVYLKVESSKIRPAFIHDPTKTANKFSLHGAFWCEARKPGCLHRFTSNIVNVTLKDVIEISMHFFPTQSSYSNETEIVKKVNVAFNSCVPKMKIEYDLQKYYTKVQNKMIATEKVNIYLQNGMTRDIHQCVSEVRSNLTIVNMTSYVVNAGVKQQNNTRIRRQVPVRSCPRNFTLQNQYCVHVTRKASWNEAYQDCFQQGIEKTPIDDENFWKNSTLVGNLISSLRLENITYIWLAAERKSDYGPLSYTGPVNSTFSYSFNETRMYDITWLNKFYDVNKKCLALDVSRRELLLLACNEILSFVCLFPSVFWTQKVTYDSFHKCNSDCFQNYKSEQGLQWQDVRDICWENGGDLMYITSESETDGNEISLYNGKHNSHKPATTDVALENKCDEWFDYASRKVKKVFLTYNKGFQLTTDDSPKVYACVKGKDHIVAELDLIKAGESYEIELAGTDEASYVFGIKCYLNGRIVKSDELAIVTVKHHGYLFCEALTHSPIILLKSKTILVQDPEIVSFACQIHNPNIPYDFAVHDLSFKNGHIGSFFYENKLTHILKGNYYVTVDKITRNFKGINIDFHIEHFSNESNLMALYKNISTSLLPVGKKVILGNWDFSVVYVRNTKYCMEENMHVDPNISNCTSKERWTLTAINKTSYGSEWCITHENKLLARKCNGSYITGAVWEPVSNTERNNVDILPQAKKLIDQTVTSIIEDDLSSLEARNLNGFIERFEDLISGNDVNGSYKSQNETAAIYSTSNINHTILGYTYNGKSQIPEITPTITNEIGGDVTVAIYLTPNRRDEENISLSVTVFQNGFLFPNSTGRHLRISSVVLMNVTDRDNIKFPFTIYFTAGKEYMNLSKPVCGFWNGKSEKWDDSGSQYMGENANGLHECSFNHLSVFTLLLKIKGDEKDDIVLDIISIAGSCLSLIGLALVLLTFITFQKWRSSIQSQIVTSLSASLFIMYFVFVTGFTQVSRKSLCIAIAAILHYSVLASFCWMFVEAFHNYLKYVKIFTTYIPRFIWIASSVAWGVPLIPVIAVLCYDSKLYIDEHYCWIHETAFTYALLLPILVIWTANVSIFCIIFYSVTCGRKIIGNYKQSYKLIQLKMSLCVFVLLGLSWTFGFARIVINQIVFSYLFSILSAFQGFFIFVFFVLNAKPTRQMWYMFLTKRFHIQVPKLPARDRKRNKNRLLDSSLDTDA
ncbi:uncharacterized protein [Periplaneta americana]|uniref:uncharacterized protein n=1 Tax=Periplaneta americana TaxID=6978 RepID=UPI0037E7ED82